MPILKYKNANGDLVGVNSYKINPVIVAQEKGTSESAVMSQKAVSDVADNIETAVASNASEIAKKANSADVYTKTDVDGKVSTINTNVNKKANSADVYNKTEVDAKVSAANTAINARLPIDSFNEWSQGVAMKSEMEGNVDELNEALDTKANSADVYDKEAVDAIVESIECDGGEY